MVIIYLFIWVLVVSSFFKGSCIVVMGMFFIDIVGKWLNIDLSIVFFCVVVVVG